MKGIKYILLLLGPERAPHKKLISMILPSKLSFVTIFLLQVVVCSLWGQVVERKQLTPEDYPLWGELQTDKINSDASWVSYSIGYESDQDTLFVRNTKSLKTYTFPAGRNGAFATSKWFACHVPEGLQLINLSTGKQELIKEVSSFAFVSKSNDLVLLLPRTNDSSALIIRKPEGKIQKQILGATAFLMSPSSEKVLYTVQTDSKNSVGLFTLGKTTYMESIIANSPNRFHNLVWHENEKAVAFLEQTMSSKAENNTVFYYRLEDKSLVHFAPDVHQDFPKGARIAPNLIYKLSISKDLQKVFFGIKPSVLPEKTAAKSDVQIWNGNAKWIYPMEQKKGKLEEMTNLAVWWPLQGDFSQISTARLPFVMLTGDQKHAILSNPQAYEPQYAYEGPRDYEIMNLDTSKSIPLLQQHSGHHLSTLPSPAGKYIAYFRDDNWWTYNIATNTHTNVTLNARIQFANAEEEMPGERAPYGNPAWSLDDSEILLYDQYDLWAFKPDGSSFRKLTHGREDHIQFRLARNSYATDGKENYNGWISNGIDFNQEVLLQAKGEDGQTGYFKWQDGILEKPIIYATRFVDKLSVTKKNNAYIYREQAYNQPPRLMIQSHSDHRKVLSQSNPQHNAYKWGKSELVEYQNSKGKTLKGVLFYPADYDPKIKYPMIVHIYERQSSELHKYVNPSQFAEDGFNVTAYTTQGYFVLYPDISFEIGDPGISALDCVVAATRKIIHQNLVDQTKIGLIGFSYGGYEANFILTQTNLFAAVVAGAGVTDLSSYYLTVGWNTGKPDMWRFESQQWRMGKSLWENTASYDRNSPIRHADKITTPLLSWTGANDKQVDWHQSVEFHLALRRLEKEHIFLMYQNESHAIMHAENQKDLSNRIQQWFGYYLKQETPPLWIKQGVTR